MSSPRHGQPFSGNAAAGSASHAVVIGAGIDGLLATVALAGRFARISVLDRGRLPDQGWTSDGLPAGHPGVGLTDRGRRAFEQLLPGLTDALVARGAELEIEPGPHRERGPSLALAVSHGLLAWQVRRQVMRLPGVRVLPRHSVLDLRGDRDRLTGVVVADLARPRAFTTVPADLVVDASGVRSRTVAWLECRGSAPPEEQTRLDAVYATRTFRRGPGDLAGLRLLRRPASAGRPRGCVAAAVEDDRLLVSLAGYHGVRPPSDLAGFVRYAASVPGVPAAALVRLPALDHGLQGRFTAAVRRRYDLMKHLPEGLVVVGSAATATDPGYGLGPELAALDAVVLRSCLGLPDGPPPPTTPGERLGVRAARASAGHRQRAWSAAVACPGTFVAGINRPPACSVQATP